MIPDALKNALWKKDDDFRYLILTTPVFSILASIWIPLHYTVLWGAAVLYWVIVVRYDAVGVYKRLNFINKNENAQAIESFLFNVDFRFNPTNLERVGIAKTSSKALVFYRRS